MGAAAYDVLKDYSAVGQDDICVSADHCIAVFRLSNPVTYDRSKSASIGDVLSGAMLRKQEPLILRQEVIHLTVGSSKHSSVANLAASIKTDKNLLSADAPLPGDWVLAWQATSSGDIDRVVNALQDGKAANWFESGLKFIGRVEDIQKHSVISNGVKQVTYSLDAVGFDELSQPLFYDPALGDVEQKQSVWSFMSRISSDITRVITAMQKKVGSIQNNSEALVDTFVNIILGNGSSQVLNESLDNARLTDLRVAPQSNAEAEFAYLVPVSVATALGKTIVSPKKGDKFQHASYGYGDLLTILSGVQKYDPGAQDSPHHGFVPTLDLESTDSRLKCGNGGVGGASYRIKSTYLPVGASFINTPLWQLLGSFVNPAINEIYTCLRTNAKGEIMPTIVYRQIPFSTDAIQESPAMPLTRYLSLPRWKIPSVMIYELHVGRANNSRFNFCSVYGAVSPYAQEQAFSLAAQMAAAPPVLDSVDIARSGIKPYTATVNCSLDEIMGQDKGRTWMLAISDWSFGNQYELTGNVSCFGIQAPIAVGDNCEIDGVVFQIENITHTSGINGGVRHFSTSLTLTKGMPVDQGEPSNIAPRYPGFAALNQEDTSILTGMNPGTTLDT